MMYSIQLGQRRTRKKGKSELLQQELNLSPSYYVASDGLSLSYRRLVEALKATFNYVYVGRTGVFSFRVSLNKKENLKLFCGGGGRELQRQQCPQ